MNKPCYKCEKRVLGCHSSCEDYRSYKEEIDSLKEKTRSSYEINDYAITKRVKVKNWYAKKENNNRARRRKR